MDWDCQYKRWGVGVRDLTLKAKYFGMYQQRRLSKPSVEFEDVDARESAENRRDEAQDISECHYFERKRHS